MKFKHKKIIPVIASALILLGATTAVAQDLSAYPSQFIKDGIPDFAVVLGSDSSPMDTIGAVQLVADLQAQISGVALIEETNGEFVNLATSNTKIYMGSMINTARKVITKSELPNILSKGIFTDDAGTDYSYTQHLTLNGLDVEFSRSGNLDEPTVHVDVGAGTRMNDKTPLYNYSISFSKAVDFSNDEDVQGQTINIMGQDFIIGSGSTEEIVYLHGEGKAVSIKEGENISVMIGDTEYSISLEMIDINGRAIINIDGEQQNPRKVGDTLRKKEMEIYVKNVISPRAVVGLVGSVKLNIGSDKIMLKDRQPVKKGSQETTVKGTWVRIISDGKKISQINIAVGKPKTSEDDFSLGDTFIDPVFNGFKFEFNSIDPMFDSVNRDRITVRTAGRSAVADFTSKLVGEEREFIFAHDSHLADSSNYPIFTVELGEEVTRGMKEYEYIVIDGGDFGRILQVEDVCLDYDSGDEVSFRDALTDEMFNVNLNEGQSIMNIDGQTYYINVTDINDPEIRITWGNGADYAKAGSLTVFPKIKLDNGEWIVFLDEVTVKNNTYVNLPGLSVNLVDSNNYYDAGNFQWVTEPSGGDVRIVGIDTDKDNVIDCNLSGPAVMIVEENRDNEVKGDVICIPLTKDGEDMAVELSRKHFSDQMTDGDSLRNDTSITKYLDRYGTLAVVDEDRVDVYYPTKQMEVNIYVAGIDTKIRQPTTQQKTSAVLGTVAFLDSDIASVGDRNLIVIGGSAVNTVSAKLLGVDYPTYGSEAEWKNATGVGYNQALIALMDSPYADDKVAMLIAGWEAKDTRLAIKKLLSETSELIGEKVVLDTV